MSETHALLDQVQDRLGALSQCVVYKDMVTVELLSSHLIEASHCLRHESLFAFEMLVDACGVDYLDYGVTEWRGEEATSTGFGRGVDFSQRKGVSSQSEPRFAMVYHLLSVSKNQRLRLKVPLDSEPLIPSLIDIWPSVNWYEREAFDLFGIYFEGHPDLRRLLTDYGFKGHPFRKDFPLIGEREMRYDAFAQRCIYEPVSIVSRTAVPKVIRKDNRYLDPCRSDQK